MGTEFLCVSVLVGNRIQVFWAVTALLSTLNEFRCRAGGHAGLALHQWKFVDSSISKLPVKITQPTNLSVLPTQLEKHRITSLVARSSIKYSFSKKP